jgi:hypothetical protein
MSQPTFVLPLYLTFCGSCCAALQTCALHAAVVQLQLTWSCWLFTSFCCCSCRTLPHCS